MTRPTIRYRRTLLAVLAAAATLSVAAPTATPVSAAVTEPSTYSTVVNVQPDQTLGTISRMLLGGNGRWAYDDFGAWDPSTQQLYPDFVGKMKTAGISTVRYPGGTIANEYHWQRAIGPQSSRIDQVHGSTGEPLDNQFGPDEFGAELDQLHQHGDIVVNFSTGTPQEAADWVQYMTGKAGSGKWADLRVRNGHSQPYNIPYWEVGNEMGLSGQYYWRGGSSNADPTTLYTFGGSATFTKQRVGKPTDYRDSAAVSDGSPNQAFVVKYAPLTTGAVHLYVDGAEWTQLGDLANAMPADHTFTLNRQTGAIAFGDGTHGAIPPTGSVITISYTSGPHPGFESFYAAMKKANPDIHVCAGLSGVAATTEFAHLMGAAHPYDCVEQHSYISAAIPTDVSPEEYHGRLMAQMGNQVTALEQIQQAVADDAGTRAAGIQVAVTEYGELGDRHPDADPSYHASLSQGILMADYVAAFIKHGIPLADKSNLTDFVNAPAPGGSTAVGAPLNAMIAGPGPDFQLAPTGLVSEIYGPMGGERAVATSVANNPTRTLGTGEQLPLLTTVAGRSAAGGLDVVVINQDAGTDVTAAVQTGIAHVPAARVATLNGPSVLSTNRPGDQQVSIRNTVAQAGDGTFTYTFPAHSVTRIHLSPLGS